MLNIVRTVAVLLLIGASAWWYTQAGAARPAAEPQPRAEGGRGGGGGGGGGGGRGRHRLGGPVAVVTGSAVRRDVPVHVDGIGTVQAFNTVTVRARVDGQLDKVAFTEGQDVRAGDVLAQIDPRPYQSRLTQMQGIKAKDEAQLANVKLDLERYVKLGQYATQQSVDTQRALVRQLEAALQTDQANVDAAALELSYATITAPISGRTGVRLVDEGNIVRAGDASGIVVITQLQPISVVFSLPQQQLVPINEALAKGKVPTSALDADGTTVLAEGVLTVVDNRIDALTGTIKLKATFANPDRKLWPGQFVNVRVELDARKDVVVVPSAAIQRNASGPFAYVVDPSDRVELRAIRVGQVQGGIAVVESGLEPGDRIVLTSQGQLRPGTIVTATPGGADLEHGNAVPQIMSGSGQSGEPARRQRPRSP